MSEWGPWIDHDGKGCPVPIGTIVERNFDRRCIGFGRIIGADDTCIYPVKPTEMASWDACHHQHTGIFRGCIAMVVRYRIRKPRGLTILEDLIADLPVEEPA